MNQKYDYFTKKHPKITFIFINIDPKNGQE
jgi:hypothetical protein